MRIISGDAKGRNLYAPSGQDTRPTSDKIRGSVFNIIACRVTDARVLDLFGGTGAMALEALSRGAESAAIADNAREAQQSIERNARSVLKDDFDYRVKLLRTDYRSAIQALSRLYAADMLAPGCMVVLERHKDADIKLPTPFEVTDSRLYGDTAVDFVEINPDLEQI